MIPTLATVEPILLKESLDLSEEAGMLLASIGLLGSSLLFIDSFRFLADNSFFDNSDGVAAPGLDSLTDLALKLQTGSTDEEIN